MTLPPRDLEWLRESFRAIDRVMFADAIAEMGVQVVWGRWRKTKKAIRFGCYKDQHKRIEISPLLKSRFFPDYVVLNNLFHEMLHASVGMEHSVEFRLREKLFPHYAPAIAWEHENAYVWAEMDPPW